MFDFRWANRLRPCGGFSGLFLFKIVRCAAERIGRRLEDAPRAGGRIGTVTGVHPGSRYGEMKVDPGLTAVTEFNEKPTLAEGWVNGGFFVCEPGVLGYLRESGLMQNTIVAFTESGNTARLLSKYRPEARIVASSRGVIVRGSTTVISISSPIMIV